MICPKCGFEQEDGLECLRCGIIFSRYRPETAPPLSKAEPGFIEPHKAPGSFRRFYRVFRWVALALLIMAISLVFRASPPPQIVSTPKAAERAGAKIEEFQSSLGQGIERRLEMNQEELNGWLSRNLALKKPSDAAAPLPQTPDSLNESAQSDAQSQPDEREALEQAPSSVRDLKIELLEDSVRIYALFELHGVDLSLELEGRPVVRDGYLRLEPAHGKLGSFPLMAGTLKSATDRIFRSPQNKEKFKLPPDIRDILIEHGQLVILAR